MEPVMWKSHVDVQVLKQYKEQRLLRCQSHPSLPLTIYNYSDECQFSKKHWDHVTMMCRGLIVHNESGQVVGRSFPKFFNSGEEDNIDCVCIDIKEPFDVYEKLDGSLGVLFCYEGQWIITSRGSFSSPQALQAAEMLTRYDISGLDLAVSYVFEILYPENRIVVDYHNREELVFLAAFETATGQEVYPMPLKQIQSAGFSVARCFEDLTASRFNELKKLNWQNEEGFIIRFRNSGQRLKIKFDQYLKDHGTINNLTTKKLFELFCEEPSSLDRHLQLVPTTHQDWFRRQWAAFETRINELHLVLQREYLEVQGIEGQKEFAMKIAKHPYKQLLFSMRSGRDLYPLLCKFVDQEGVEKLAVARNVAVADCM